MTAELLEPLQAALRGVEADDVEISARAGRAGYTRFAENEVTQASTVDEVAVRVRVLRGGRLGAAQCDGLRPERLADTARKAAALADLAPPIPEHPGFARAGEVRGPARAHDPATAGAVAAPAQRAAPLGRIFERLRGERLGAAGLMAVQAWSECVVTKGGTAGVAEYTTARLDLTAVASGTDGAGPSGFSQDVQVAMGTLDVEAVGARAADAARRARDPIEAAPGTWDVILEPRAVTEVMEWLAMASLGSQGWEDGTGFLTGKDGQRVTGERVTLVDDGLDPDARMLPTAFDAEGTPKQRVVLLDRGVARRPVWDRLSARRAGTESTGHAPGIDDEAAMGSIPANLSMAAGEDRVDDLLARTERGLWVTRFHYVNGLIDPRRAVMTGMTRDGLFLIENGRIGRPVRNLRWTESILEAFARIEGVTSERRAAPRWWSAGGAYLAPTILVRDWHFTGRSR